MRHANASVRISSCNRTKCHDLRADGKPRGVTGVGPTKLKPHKMRNESMRISFDTARVVAYAGLFAFAAGCTTNPYTREQQASNAAKGAAIGAVAGGAIGAISGDDSRERRKRALIGAGVGALAGASVGYYMDQQEMKLRQQLEGSGVSVTRVGDDIVLNMPGNVTFEVNRADITPRFYEVLNSVVLVLKEFDKTIIEVSGHTDSTGDAAYNRALSEQRAQSVGQYLQSQGIATTRVLMFGYGEDRPVASNASEDGRQLNRRVELTLAPLTS